MPNQATLEEVEKLALELPSHEQLKLISVISEWLNQRIAHQLEQGPRDEEYFRQAQEFLRMCEKDPADAVGEFDSAEDIRQIREERASRL